VTFKASGQTGVSIAVGESAFVYYNGTDYVKVSSTVATGVTSFTAGTTGFTPSTATTGAVTLAGTLGTANGGTNLTSFTSGGVVYASSSSALATGSGLIFDGTNLGVGVTPSAWTSPYKAIEVGFAGCSVASFSQTSMELSSNAKYTSSNDRFAGTGYAAKYQQSAGVHRWYTSSASGTVDNVISYSQLMTLDASGNLGVGTTSPRAKLNLEGGSTTSINATACWQYIGSGAAASYTSSNYMGVGFGYNNAGNSEAPAFIGFTVTDASSSTNGALVFATRSVTTATAPTERLRITSAGDVGIGTSSPASKLDVSGQITATGGIFKANGAPSLSAATAGEAILAPEGTYGALLYGRGSTYDVVIGQRSTGVALAVVAATNNIYTGGNIGLTTTPTTSGTGITFPATQSASSNANTLDDYEEGTWTPTVLYSGTNTPTYSNQFGTYTKIGRLVTVQLYLNWNENGSTGNVTFEGLPFTSLSVQPRAICSVWSLGLTGLPLNISITAYVLQNTQSIYLFLNDNLASRLTDTYTDADQDVYCTVSYIV
jgi:hypothetical protein